MWWLNLSTALGTLILAVPGWRLNRNKKLLQRLKDADRPDVGDDDFRKRVRDIAEEKQKDEVATWRWWHEACLWAGYACVAIGALGRLLAT